MDAREDSTKPVRTSRTIPHVPRAASLPDQGNFTRFRARATGLVGGLSLLLGAVGAVGAQEPDAPTRPAVAGEDYRAGGLHRFLFGGDYRDLWTSPIQVEVLNVETYAGGLTPVMRVGGQQSMGLALRGADGRDYTFRGIDKDPSSVLPEDLQGTFLDEIVQDQISSSHPASSPVAEDLSRAAGIPSLDSRVVLLGDSPGLREFREDFAGVLGTISVFPQPVSETNPGFEGATEILDHEELYALIRRSSADRIDDEALLRARLFDMLIGDWDRHRRQWRWAKFPGSDRWQPIPEDRDQAFSRYDGVLLGIARLTQPRLVLFGPEYPGALGLNWNGWEQDRVLLTGLDWPTWERIARGLGERITDDAIERAARRMPPAYFALDGRRLIEALKARRDALPEAARDFYELLAQEVDVRGTDQAEVAELQWDVDGTVQVTITSLGADDEPAGDPIYRRRFRPEETSEVRLYLLGGDDRAVVRGPRGGIRLHVVAGDGRDVLDDTQTGGTRFYDSSDVTQLREGPGSRLDTRQYEAPVPLARLPWVPPQDWGSRTLAMPTSGWSADFGLLLGGYLDYKRYGFRKNPYSSRHTITGGYAFRAQAAHVEYRGEFHRQNSDAFTSLTAVVGGLELLRYFGPGNETTDDRGDDFYKVEQTQYLFAPAFTFPLAGAIDATLGPIAKYVSTENRGGRLIGELEPYGAEDFGQIGSALELELDTRDSESAPTRGLYLTAAAAVYPSWWDVERTFGQLSGQVSGYLTARGRFETTLALRVGGQQNWGRAPFHESAFVGGGTFFGESQAVRGLAQNRYAGEASLFANAEIRPRLGSTKLLIPTEVGLIALADLGRVFVEGEGSKTWHRGYGGGIWFAVLQRTNVLSIMAAESEGRAGLYVRMDFAF